MRWFTSDWHVNHANIIEYTGRPFWKTVTEDHALGQAEREIPDTDAMNKVLIDNFNDRVGVDDEAWFIGDVAMGSRSVSLPLFKQLKCRNLFLVPGNHDNCHPMFKPYRKAIPMYEDAGFKIMNVQETIQIAGQDVLVCHFPYWGDSGSHDDRYSAQRPDDTGLWLIHGHTHAPEQVNYSRRQLHVGVDAWDLKPVPEQVVAEIITRG